MEGKPGKCGRSKSSRLSCLKCLRVKKFLSDPREFALNSCFHLPPARQLGPGCAGRQARETVKIRGAALIVEDDGFRLEALVFLGGPGQQEGVGDRGFALVDGGDDIGTAQPVGLGQVGGRP